MSEVTVSGHTPKITSQTFSRPPTTQVQDSPGDGRGGRRRGLWGVGSHVGCPQKAPLERKTQSPFPESPSPGLPGACTKTLPTPQPCSAHRGGLREEPGSANRRRQHPPADSLGGRRLRASPWLTMPLTSCSIGGSRCASHTPTVPPSPQPEHPTPGSTDSSCPT